MKKRPHVSQQPLIRRDYDTTYDPKGPKEQQPQLLTLQSLIDKYLSDKETLLVVLLLATLVRSLVGLSPYSGEKTPPHYGDFECHRFWMETTHHYPPRLWYVDGPHMNTSYWPMDYPPLCAYTHWFMANIVS